MTTTDDRLVFPAHAWPLFKDSLQHIADHPDEFYMDAYVLDRDALVEQAIREIEEFTGHPFPTCGTVACLAGRITLLADPSEKDPDETTAFAALGLGSSDGYARTPVTEQLEEVFLMTHIRTYAELREALEAQFTFPEPLPVPSVVSRDR